MEKSKINEELRLKRKEKRFEKYSIIKVLAGVFLMYKGLVPISNISWELLGMGVFLIFLGVSVIFLKQLGKSQKELANENRTKLEKNASVLMSKLKGYKLESLWRK
ncbi:MAG: hypothetical protein ABJF65_00390 [Reichenbachiella sp.]|uniref:hypothetical protein n=1 Tax=Reichenbachiella sp. TaxID=2184521 RepID=UPI0032668693